MTAPSPKIQDRHNPPRHVVTVLGAVTPDNLGLTDAHGHVWIDPPPGVAPDAPSLADYNASLAELVLFKNAGGGTLVDCQPGKCGRDVNKLVKLSQESDVHLITCTGFHLRKYYCPGDPFLQSTVDQAADLFTDELQNSLLENNDDDRNPVRAGFIKVACETTLRDSPISLLEAAAQASIRTDAAIAIHTEKGSDAEAIISFFINKGVGANRLILCHIDKRPDFFLHRDLAKTGILLEYDTFFRPKYDPDQNVWPLLIKMIGEGFDQSVILAADFAEPSMWKVQGGKPGLAGFLSSLLERLHTLGFSETTIRKLLGTNIGERLAKS